MTSLFTQANQAATIRKPNFPCEDSAAFPSWRQRLLENPTHGFDEAILCLLARLLIAPDSFMMLMVFGCDDLYAKEDRMVMAEYDPITFAPITWVHIHLINLKFLLQDLKKPLFDDVFPVDRNRSDVCAFGVEANKVHTPRLLALQKYYTNLGLNVHYMRITSGDLHLGFRPVPRNNPKLSKRFLYQNLSSYK